MTTEKPHWFPFKDDCKLIAIRCPFHEEKTPSCMLSPKANTFRCFGCGIQGHIDENGNLIEEETITPTIAESAWVGTHNAREWAKKFIEKNKELMKRLADR